MLCRLLRVFRRMLLGQDALLTDNGAVGGRTMPDPERVLRCQEGSARGSEPVFSPLFSSLGGVQRHEQSGQWQGLICDYRMPEAVCPVPAYGGRY